jgi:hypothetical protein
VIDLTADAPVNHLAATQFEESLTQRQVRAQNGNCSPVVIDDDDGGGDMSIPVKQKK